QDLYAARVVVSLTYICRADGARAGELLREKELIPDVVYTSRLKRAILTADIALEAADLSWLSVHRSWRLNERHYGALQGQNKEEIREGSGEGQLVTWRRSFDTPPPALAARYVVSQASTPPCAPRR